MIIIVLGYGKYIIFNLFECRNYTRKAEIYDKGVQK